MKKKRVIFYVLTILLLAIVFFWYLGKTEEQKKLEAEQKALAEYESIIRQNSFLESMVANTYTTRNETSNIPLSNNPYTPTNLNVNHDSLLSDVEVYANNLKNILTPYAEPRPNEANLVLEVLKNNDLSQLKILDNSLKLHQEALIKLVQIEIPNTAQLVHLRLVNNIKDQIDLLTKMKNLNNDPKTALEAALDYPVVASSFFQATNNINIYLENRGVTFTEAERVNLFYNL